MVYTKPAGIVLQEIAFEWFSHRDLINNLLQRFGIEEETAEAVERGLTSLCTR